MANRKESDERRHARGNRKSKACGSCSPQFLEDISKAAREKGESKDEFVFRAVWDRYRAHLKLTSEENGPKFLAFQKFLHDKHADPILIEILERVLERYLPT